MADLRTNRRHLDAIDLVENFNLRGGREVGGVGSDVGWWLLLLAN